MLGLMQSQPLLISTLVEFAERHHGDAQIVSRRVEGDIHRYTYRDMAARARQLANTLDAEGLAASARVASLAWNGYRHLEMYYGVSGSGRVLHTINPRLHPDQVAWIVNHAEDEVLCFDLTFLPIVQAVHAKCPSVRRWVALCDADRLPEGTGIPQLTSYESWIGAASSDYAWPEFDENSASSLCYTSGTTGHPKGVLYSHRSSVLHAYAAALPDVMGLSASDSVLPVVPMFHVNAWGIPYSAPLTGCKLVFPGPALDGKSVYDLMDAEGVTFAAGVPTVWQMLLQHVRSIGARFGKLRRTVIGGSACPPAMIEAFQNEYGVRVLHAWGMTEMSPLGTLCSLKNKHLDLPEQERMKILLKQGRAIYGVDMKIVDGEGRELPWDGKTYGDLLVKGPWIVDRYYRSDESPPGARRAGPRLVPDGRRGDHRPRRLHADHGPQQGRDQVRWRMDQLHRHREHRHGASSRGHGGMRGHAASEVGRATHRGRRAAPGRRTHARGTVGLLRGEDREMADSGRCRVPRCDPHRRDREDAQGEAARPVAGLPPARALSAAGAARGAGGAPPRVASGIDARVNP